MSARESFPPARSFSSAAPESEALDAALSRPRAEDFDKGDVDGDGLLTPEELAGVLVRSCHAREADALELVRVCFGDVDLDKDGRVCFDEYRVFCKKAKRVLRRRALVAGAAAPFGAAERSVRRLTFGTHSFGSARSASRETRTHRPASARVNRSLDALCEKNAKAARPASARLLSRPFSGAARVPVEARARQRAFAEEDSTMDFSAADLSAADLTSLDLTVDEAFIADERDVTHDLEPVAEAFEAETLGDDARRATSSEGRRVSVDSAFVDAQRLAVWRAEFNAHDARKTGRLDLELATFALARLRLLEDLDVSLAARTLETRLAETAGGEDVRDVDFEAFARFAAALEAARATQTRTEKPIAQPVPVRKEYALDDAHPFLALFRETFADAHGEMDGDAFARVLRAARLTDDARLTATGVDVVFARARARHNKEGDRTARRRTAYSSARSASPPGTWGWTLKPPPRASPPARRRRAPRGFFARGSRRTRTARRTFFVSPHAPAWRVRGRRIHPRRTSGRVSPRRSRERREETFEKTFSFSTRAFNGDDVSRRARKRKRRQVFADAA